ncbi:MAG TPA: glycosyltransferase family 87 protein [Stellaceae bacterium]|nr:glycosyltransferase family 87 protein [Stellaceae bacterium]
MSGEPAGAHFAAPIGGDAAATVGSDGAPHWPLSPKRAVTLALICGAAGLAAWALWIWVFFRDPGQDWMVFYTAARAYFDGNLPLVFDGRTLTAALNQRFALWLSQPLILHPWVYPPSFLLLFLPFGLLPPAASLAAFLLIGFAAAILAALLHFGRGMPRWIAAFSLLLCPAVPFDVMTGQNAFFTSALLLGGFGLLGRSPVLAGALFGVLTLKPQLWLLVPVALLATRQWRALVSTAASAAALALLSLAVFGPGIWQAWIAMMTGADEAYRAWVTAGRLNGVSVFACVSALNAPQALASLAQWVAVALAAAFVYETYRHRSMPSLQLAALLAATMLAAPHASASDAVLLGLAAGLFITAPRMSGLRTSEIVLAAAVWISPLFAPPRLLPPGALTPLLILLFLAMVMAAMRRYAADVVDPAGVAASAGQ